MGSEIDVRELAIRRGDAGPERRGSTPPLARPRRVWSRYVLPACVLAGFAALGLWAFRESILPTHEVTVVSVLVEQGTQFSVEGTALFQAAGWVEPRPTPIVVRPLAEGTLEELLVLEGDRVEPGAPVARLITVDAELARDRAQAQVALREAEVVASWAELLAARTQLANPLEIEAELAQAAAEVARLQRELAELPALVRQAEAEYDSARRRADARAELGGDGGAFSELTVDVARNEAEAARARLEGLEARRPAAERELQSASERRDALARRRELLTEEHRRVAEALAGVRSAKARLEDARAALRQAQLQVERMTVRAPSAGYVLQLVALPGSRVGSQSGAPPATDVAGGLFYQGEALSGAVCTLYQPESLQMRVDVPLEHVGAVEPGQRVEIEVDAWPGRRLPGRVLYLTSRANIQKNTVEVKVSIDEAEPMLRPEMIGRVTFLAPPAPQVDSPATPGRRSASAGEPLLVPEELVERDGQSASVWVADLAERVARRRSITLGRSTGDGWVEVTEGLAPSDRVIASGRESLHDGARIRVIGEEP